MLALALVAAALAFPGPLPTLCETQRLSPPGAATGDRSGFAVAIDGTRAIIGAPFDDDSGSASGSAYVYVFDDRTWVFEAKLTANDGSGLDNFGSAVAIAGNIAVVGAPFDDDAASNAGAAYVFAFTGGGWFQQDKLTASDGAAGDAFGFAVATDGTRTVVGAPRDDAITGTAVGSAYVFTASGDRWSQQAKLAPAVGFASTFFGSAVAIDGAVILVGAPGDAEVNAGAGAAYVFTGPAWLDQEKLVDRELGFGANAGAAVALAGDLAVVGAPGDQAAATTGGAAILFQQVRGRWTLHDRLVAPEPQADAQFGTEVALADGLLAIGAPRGGRAAAGVAWLFEASAPGVFEATVRLTSSTRSSGDELGAAVSAAPGFVIVGAPRDDIAGGDDGAAFVYRSLEPADCNSNGIDDTCDIASGMSDDDDDDGVPDECRMNPGDINDDAIVNGRDLEIVIDAWGPCPPPPMPCPGDVDDDGMVSVNDLILIIINWG